MALEALKTAPLSSAYHPEAKTSVAPRALHTTSLPAYQSTDMHTLRDYNTSRWVVGREGNSRGASWMGYPYVRGTVADSVADRTTEV